MNGWGIYYPPAIFIDLDRAPVPIGEIDIDAVITACDADMDFVFGTIGLPYSSQYAERRLHCLGTRRALCALVEATGQPSPEAFAADWPIFLVAVHIKAGISNIIAIVKKLDRRRELDQDVGLLLSQFNRTGRPSFFSSSGSGVAKVPRGWRASHS